MAILLVAPILFAGQILAWRGKVFAVDGRKVTVTSPSKGQPSVGVRLYIIQDGAEIGQAVVAKNFHSKTVMTIKSGKAVMGATVTDRPVETVIQKTAKPNKLDAALLAVAWDGEESEARELIAAGANVNAVDANGFSAAMVAARRANAPVLKVLIAAKADLKAVDKRGRTIFMLPEPQVFPKVKKILDDAKADLQ